MSENQVVEQKQELQVAPQKQSFSLAPKDFEQALKFSEMMSKSNLVPKEFVGNAGNIMVAVQWGMELGLQPMQAMQNIAVINGRPSLWGDSVMALARSSSLCEYIIEEDDGKVATCRAKRKGQDAEIVASFSMEDATKAGLAGKQGPWTQYPKRMRQMRARAFCLRDAFPDVLRGMPIAEELQDYEPIESKPQPKTVVQAPVEKKIYTDEEFVEKSAAWSKLVFDKKKTSADLITFIESKNSVLTEDQKLTIHSWGEAN
ncbi:recombinase RecT [Polynucleobacter sp. AP-RePozz3-80-G7]|uniref:recombinase RecT n=1 Tax=Polynucleobacter sp. AP-RePozz3-80-G7 TaxID=2689105 RepID=UPI001DC015ED|nr:recombinase RecT [Polynucleobacter sp. AP-RePozz3-80-G7]MBU3639991.1 recombinase RecT [Polynucleobacter sp. AP-RePozz3-80-G7]